MPDSAACALGQAAGDTEVPQPQGTDLVQPADSTGVSHGFADMKGKQTPRESSGAAGTSSHCFSLGGMGRARRGEGRVASCWPLCA